MSLRRLLPRSIRRPTWPTALLWLVLLTSLGARSFRLGEPGEGPPGHGFIFDEKYYVNAARVIAGVAFPASDTYHPDAVASPQSGFDPNAEHPQLGKLLIAAGIRVFGDGPVGWRIAAVVFGTLALLALHWLVRSAGGDRWLALGATAIMAFENLELVHGRIGVLDVFSLPFLLGGIALWLRGRPTIAGLCIGIGCCMKLFAALGLIAIVLIELMRVGAALWERRRHAEPTTASEPTLSAPADPRRRGDDPLVGPRPLRRGLRVLLCVGVTAASFLLVLAILDHYVPAYSSGIRVSTGHPWDHLRFMLDYGRELRSPNGPRGIASYPWQFWIDVEPTNYFTSTVRQVSGGEVVALDTPIVFTGLINPLLIVLALPALVLAAVAAVRTRQTLAFVVVAGYLATWVPWLVVWQLDRRTVYLYYMVMTVPFVCIAVASLLASRRVPRVALGIWIGGFVAAFCVLYPFRTYPFT